MVSRSYGKERLMTLYEKIMSLHSSLEISDFDMFGTIQLRNDGQTPPEGKVCVGNDYINTWTHESITQPTQSQIDAVTE